MRSHHHLALLCAAAALLLIALAPAVARAQLPTSDSDPRVFKGQWKWHAGLSAPPKRDKPEQACQDWAKDVRPKGQPHKFIKVKPGTSKADEDKTCVFYDEISKKQWDQTNGAISEYVCPPNSRVITLGNAGTAETHRCWCDEGKTCATTPAPAEAPKPVGPPPKSKLCQGKPGYPPAKVDKRVAARRSRDNKLAAASDKNAGSYQEAYADAREEIRREQNAVMEEKYGVDLKGRGFPSYSKKYPDTKRFREENKKYPEGDFCPGVPNDINIGHLCGSREEDFKAANLVAGLAETPKNCVWHHHEEMGRMQLIRRDVHGDVNHWGGVSVWKRAYGLKDYPLWAPK